MNIMKQCSLVAATVVIGLVAVAVSSAQSALNAGVLRLTENTSSVVVEAGPREGVVWRVVEPEGLQIQKFEGGRVGVFTYPDGVDEVKVWLIAIDFDAGTIKDGDLVIPREGPIPDPEPGDPDPVDPPPTDNTFKAKVREVLNLVDQAERESHRKALAVNCMEVSAKWNNGDYKPEAGDDRTETTIMSLDLHNRNYADTTTQLSSGQVDDHVYQHWSPFWQGIQPLLKEGRDAGQDVGEMLAEIGAVLDE